MPQYSPLRAAYGKDLSYLLNMWLSCIWANFSVYRSTSCTVARGNRAIWLWYGGKTLPIPHSVRFTCGKRASVTISLIFTLSYTVDRLIVLRKFRTCTFNRNFCLRFVAPIAGAASNLWWKHGRERCSIARGMVTMHVSYNKWVSPLNVVLFIDLY